MTFKNAVAACLAQYTVTQGRASRSEFWYFVLFAVLLSVFLYILDFILPPRVAPIILSLVLIALAIPLFSVFVRRLHDIGAPAWRVLFIIIPVVHLVCVYWALKPSQEGENKYGEYPVS